MLMDMLCEVAETARAKRRCHFYEFMNDFHARAHRRKGEAADVVELVAQEMYAEAQLVCLDEMQVTDIADAVVLRRLFRSLFQRGLVLVTTSNRPPDDLYFNGIQREMFLPFIALVKQHCLVHSMTAGTDYRLTGKQAADLYQVLSPEQWTAADDKHIDQTFHAVAAASTNRPAATESLFVNGRRLNIPRAAGRVAYFTFRELCEKPLSAMDYIAICNNFHTVFLSRVPKLGLLRDRNSARRLITFIDEAYDHRVKLILSAEAEAGSLFDNEGLSREGPAASDEVFAASRTESRLFEMQSEAYTRAEWRPQAKVV